MAVAPAPYPHSFPQSDASTVFPSSSEFDPHTGEYYAGTTTPSAFKVSDLDDIYSTSIYRKVRKIGIAIGLVTTIRVVILALLFCAWSLRCFLNLIYPDSYDPGNPYYEYLNLESSLIPVQLRNWRVVRYPFACVFSVDTVVCLSIAVICCFVKNLPWIVLLCTLWFCFMLLTLAFYIGGTVMNFYFENYETLFLIHLILLPIIMTLLIFNIILLRRLVKMGYTSFPKANAAGIVKKPKGGNQGAPMNQQGSEYQYNMAMDNQGMYNNIFGGQEYTGYADNSGAYPNTYPYSNSNPQWQSTENPTAYPSTTATQNQSNAGAPSGQQPMSTMATQNQSNVGAPADPSTNQMPAEAAATASPAPTSTVPEPNAQQRQDSLAGPNPGPATYNQYYYQQPTSTSPQNPYSDPYPNRYDMDPSQRRMTRNYSTTIGTRRATTTSPQTERRKSKEPKKRKEKKKKDKKKKKKKKHKS